MRTKSLCKLFAVCASVGAVALDASDARAQTRRRPRGTQDNPTTTATSTAPTDTSTPASESAPRSAASSGASSSSGPARNADGTLVSNLVNRPGMHATRVSAEIFLFASPAAWAWAWGGFVTGPGVRLGAPLTRNGPIASMNNDLRLMIGAQWYVTFNSGGAYWWLSAPVTLQWNFFLSPQWSASLEAGLAVDFFVPQIDWLNCYDHPQLYCDRVAFHPAGGFGLRRHFSQQPGGFPAVNFRFAYPGGIQVGLEL